MEWDDAEALVKCIGGGIVAGCRYGGDVERCDAKRCGRVGNLEQPLLESNHHGHFGRTAMEWRHVGGNPP